MAETFANPDRTRSETIDFLGLVFSIRIRADARFDTLDEIAAATGLATGLIRSLAECRLIRLNDAAPHGLASAEEVRLAAIIGELLDLGCEARDLVALADRRHDRPIGSAADPDTPGRDAIEAVRAVLDRLWHATRASTDPRDELRHRRLCDVITSIEVLDDLV